MDEASFRTEYRDCLAPLQLPGTWGTFRKAAGGPVQRYSVLASLGSGGFGEVFLAVDEERSEVIALKLLHPGRLTRDRVRLFAKEQLRNRRFARRPGNMVRYRDSGKFMNHSGGPRPRFLAMEFVSGRTLRTVLQTWTRLPPLEIVRVASEVCETLAELHNDRNNPAVRGTVHRDLKPENLILDAAIHGRTLVADLGIAKELTLPDNQRRGIAGTAGYIAPEIYRGLASTPQADLYSLGSVMYEMACGHVPFRMDALADFWNLSTGDPDAAFVQAEAQRQYQASQTEVPPKPHEVVPGFPRELSELIMSLLQRDPAARPKNASLVHARLQRLFTFDSVRQCQVLHPDWPVVPAPEVLNELRTLTANRLHVSAQWLLTRSGQTTVISEWLHLILELLQHIDEVRRSLQTLIQDISGRSGSAATSFSVVDVEQYRPTITKLLNDVEKHWRSLGLTVRQVPELNDAQSDWLRLFTTFHDDATSQLDSGSPDGLLNCCYLTRSKMIEHSRRVVAEFSRVADLLLMEMIRT